MILVVDDDVAMLEFVCDVLAADGLPARAVSSAREALELLDEVAPALVISDVVMPELSGFDLRRAYLEAHPDRDTPFVFLSSNDDPRTIVRGLEDGADDYLVKPVRPELLVAKARSILRRHRQRRGVAFRGDLADFPLSTVLRFCEDKGLTGYLDVHHARGVTTLRFDGGRLDEAEAAARLDEILALAQGSFEIWSCPVDFDAIRAPGAPRRPPSTEPVGRVSGVRLKDRLLQVQTQIADGRTPFVVTLVTIEGKVAWKRRVAVPAGVDGEALQRLIDDEHEAVEREVETKLAAFSEARPADRKVDLHRLCDEGYERYRAGDLEGAIACWSDALSIDPDANAIAVNLRIATEKLAARREGR